MSSCRGCVPLEPRQSSEGRLERTLHSWAASLFRVPLNWSCRFCPSAAGGRSADEAPAAASAEAAERGAEEQSPGQHRRHSGSGGNQIEGTQQTAAAARPSARPQRISSGLLKCSNDNGACSRFPTFPYLTSADAVAPERIIDSSLSALSRTPAIWGGVNRRALTPTQSCPTTTSLIRTPTGPPTTTTTTPCLRTLPARAEQRWRRHGDSSRL